MEESRSVKGEKMYMERGVAGTEGMVHAVLVSFPFFFPRPVDIGQVVIDAASEPRHEPV